MSLEVKVNSLQEQIENYKSLTDLDKLGKNSEITKLINECETKLNEYKTLTETSITCVEENSDEISSTVLTQEEYIEILEQINISQQLLKTFNSNDLDLFTQIYFELSNNIKKCKQYLESKKMTINYM